MFVNIRCKMYSIYTPVGDSRLPSAVTDLFTVKILMLRLFPKIDIKPPKNGLLRAISGHTIFEVSTQNRTPTSFHASAKKTRRRNFVSMLIVFFSSSACFKRRIVDNAFLNSTWYLVGTESKWPHLCGSTNCHEICQSLL